MLRGTQHPTTVEESYYAIHTAMCEQLDSLTPLQKLKLLLTRGRLSLALEKDTHTRTLINIGYYRDWPTGIWVFRHNGFYFTLDGSVVNHPTPAFAYALSRQGLQGSSQNIDSIVLHAGKTFSASLSTQKED